MRSKQPQNGGRATARWRRQLETAFNAFKLLAESGILLYSLAQSGIATLIFGFGTTYVATLTNAPQYFKYASVVFFFIACFCAVAMYRLYRTRPSVAQMRIINEISDLFASLAIHSAECDKALFDSLYTRIKESGPAAAEITLYSIVGIAKTAATENIADLVTFAVEIFRKYTGDTCAVCIKILEDNPKAPIGELPYIVRAKYRDAVSRNKRKADDAPVEAHRNTAFQKIMRELEPYYLENDLRAAEAVGTYVNARANYHEDYNATLVYPITLEGHLPQIVRNNDTVVSNNVIGFICIDNMRGNFDRSLCINYMQILSARLAIMLYRIDQLERDVA